ncbi:nuclear transport factor 2 family protein [Pseudoalteromonas sp. 2CM39R]|uniref:nuclear transport factor 2 family protein n=1 Tax=Pseudoalteromonas sp. 2CM39R TaxID=2929856 RepID=UPI0020BF2139|nr:nuclear transport factor 2 family protein [Pseudoalteromonas sp. 2CM39R]MCK8127161.1 nuclear transport factor 2 family protein [Pseudoalteromonas sp. 2CM39R]
MKHLYFLAICLFSTFSSQAKQANPALTALAQQYFITMVATQAPNATNKELEAFLALLTDDVANQHLPYQTDDSREPDGKAMMRKGMTFYLGAHTEYQANLLDTFIFNDSAIALRYTHHAKGTHPQNQQEIEYTQTIMDVLEIEDGKIAVIRKYHE